MRLTVVSLTCLIFLMTACKETRTVEEIKTCIDEQASNYKDICARSTTGYEWMYGRHAHYFGAVCGAVGVGWCLDINTK